MAAAFRAVALCVAGALTCAVLREARPEFRLAVSAAVGLAALLLLADGVRAGVEAVKALAAESGTAGESAALLIRAAGMALLAEFGAQLCRDAGESALAGRVELAGRVALLSLSAPLLMSLARRLTSLLP